LESKANPLGRHLVAALAGARISTHAGFGVVLISTASIL